MGERFDVASVRACEVRRPSCSLLPPPPLACLFSPALCRSPKFTCSMSCTLRLCTLSVKYPNPNRLSNPAPVKHDCAANVILEGCTQSAWPYYHRSHVATAPQPTTRTPPRSLSLRSTLGLTRWQSRSCCGWRRCAGQPRCPWDGRSTRPKTARRTTTMR